MCFAHSLGFIFWEPLRFPAWYWRLIPWYVSLTTSHYEMRGLTERITVWRHYVFGVAWNSLHIFDFNRILFVLPILAPVRASCCNISFPLVEDSFLHFLANLDLYRLWSKEFESRIRALWGSWDFLRADEIFLKTLFLLILYTHGSCLIGLILEIDGIKTLIVLMHAHVISAVLPCWGKSNQTSPLIYLGAHRSETLGMRSTEGGLQADDVFLTYRLFSPYLLNLDLHCMLDRILISVHRLLASHVTPDLLSSAFLIEQTWYDIIPVHVSRCSGRSIWFFRSHYLRIQFKLIVWVG